MWQFTKVLVCMRVQSLSCVQHFTTTRPPGSSGHVTLQQRILEWLPFLTPFPTQGLNPWLLHWQGDSLPLKVLGWNVNLIVLKKTTKLQSVRKVKWSCLVLSDSLWPHGLLRWYVFHTLVSQKLGDENKKQEKHERKFINEYSQLL